MKYKIQKPNAFTLIEALFAVLLIGVAIVSLLGANIALTNANSAGADLSTAEFLIEQIRELTTLLPVVDPQTATTTFGPEAGETTLANYDDVDDFNGASFSPPVNNLGQAINQLSRFTQLVTVENVSAGNFQQTVAAHSSDFVRVTVQVSANSEEIASASWIRARY